MSDGFCGSKFNVNTYYKVPLGLQSSGLETLQDFIVIDDTIKRKNYFCNSDYYMWKKKIMWWIILFSMLTHGLLAVAFICVVTNFMAHLSYLNGTLREKDAVLNRPLAVKLSFIICLFILYEDVWEEEVWPLTFLILALNAIESV
jgi:hypothetical protein